jgi:hypothetical protein
MAWEGNIWYFQRVAFQSPLVHDSDHCAFVATFHASKMQQLTTHRCCRQRLPLWFPPEPHNKLTHTFKALKQTCIKADPQSRGGNDWISAETWRLISHRSMLCRTGKVFLTGGGCLWWRIWDALHGDHRARTARVGNSINSKLTRENVQEAFHHLKGWYRAALETTTRPCPQTMVKQMAERV